LKQQRDRLDRSLLPFSPLHLAAHWNQSKNYFFSPADLAKQAVLETGSWKWPTAHGSHSAQENSALLTFVKNAWGCPKGIPEAYSFSLPSGNSLQCSEYF